MFSAIFYRLYAALPDRSNGLINNSSKLASVSLQQNTSVQCSAAVNSLDYEF